MACLIRIPYTNTSDAIINRAKAAIINEGGTFEGNASAGSFSVAIVLGKIEANYAVLGNEVEITITKKPFLLSCKRIEDFLKKQLKS